MLKIHPVPAFSDNYIWLLHDAAGNAFVVDPGDADPVLAFLGDRGLRLQGILITHHHADHTGGVEGLLGRCGDIPVLGPVATPFPGITHPLEAGERVRLLGVEATVLDVPGHTLDHIAYLVPGCGTAAPILFCGDTLFAGGCGRVFEGTPAMMHASLSRLAGLPADTLVCCAHEYTLSNLRFALAVEPANAELRAREAHDSMLRTQGMPTLPSTLGMEMATNPFLRCGVSGVRAAAEAHAGRELPRPADVFETIRAWKDVFR